MTVSYKVVVLMDFSGLQQGVRAKATAKIGDFNSGVPVLLLGAKLEVPG